MVILSVLSFPDSVEMSHMNLYSFKGKILKFDRQIFRETRDTNQKIHITYNMVEISYTLNMKGGAKYWKMHL